jgi:hypothetical protein
MFSVLSNEKKEKVVLSVATTADFKDITSVKLEEFSYEVTQIIIPQPNRRQTGAEEFKSSASESYILFS